MYLYSGEKRKELKEGREDKKKQWRMYIQV
jgi:hypothetical protein